MYTQIEVKGIRRYVYNIRVYIRVYIMDFRCTFAKRLTIILLYIVENRIAYFVFFIIFKFEFILSHYNVRALIKT